MVEARISRKGSVVVGGSCGVPRADLQLIVDALSRTSMRAIRAEDRTHRMEYQLERKLDWIHQWMVRVNPTAVLMLWPGDARAPLLMEER